MNKQIKQIQHAVDNFVGLDDSFKGSGAEAIRSFYKECHIPFLMLMEGFILDYRESLRGIQNSLRSMEPTEDGLIRQDFLQNDVTQGVNKVERVATQLTDEANSIIQSIRGIVSVSELDDGEFLQETNKSKQYVDDTIEKLHTFDMQSNSNLESTKNDLQVMKTYISGISRLFQSGNLSVGNYSIRSLSDHRFHQELMGAVRGKALNNTLSLDILLGIGGKYVISKYVPLPDILIKHIQEKYEMRTMDYTVRALSAISDASSDVITLEEFSTFQGEILNGVEVTDYKKEHHGNYLTLQDGRIIREYLDAHGNLKYKFAKNIPTDRIKPVEKEKNWFEKSIDSFNEIGSDIWQSMSERSDKKFDSLYDFGNYATMGLFDGVNDTYEGMEYRAENMLNSPSDFANWLTMGSVDMVNSAVNPEENFSKEHWLGSIGVFLSVIGVKTGSQVGKPKPNIEIKHSKPGSNTSVKPSTGAQAKLPTLTNIREWFRVNMPEIGLVQDSMGNYHFIVGKKGDKLNITGKVPYGDHFTKENGKKVLRANVQYETKEGYKYKTNENGVISEVEGTLKLGEGERNLYAQRIVGREYRQPDDDGGHLIATQFLGSGELDNLVPMNSQINRAGGKWYHMEKEWAHALKDGKEVDLRIEPIYEKGDLRPYSFEVEYTIEGMPTRFIEILNKPGG